MFVPQIRSFVNIRNHAGNVPRSPGHRKSSWKTSEIFAYLWKTSGLVYSWTESDYYWLFWCPRGVPGCFEVVLELSGVFRGVSGFTDTLIWALIPPPRTYTRPKANTTQVSAGHKLLPGCTWNRQGRPTEDQFSLKKKTFTAKLEVSAK